MFFIEDGYSRTVLIGEVHGLHPALKVRYRPALSETRFQFLQARDVDGREQMVRVGKLLAKHLESWDAKTRNGDVAPITEEWLAKLHPALLSKVLDIVLSYSPAEEVADEKN